MLKLDGVAFTYGKRQLFRDVSFSLAPGEVAAIWGVSGKGKTTLGRIIAGHLRPEAGKIFLRDREITGRPSRSVFLVSQDSDLFPWQTVRQHLDFVSSLKTGAGGGSVAPEEALRLVRLENEEKKFPRALSGGMQKRLALARALVLDPTILVLDETFSPLDGALRQEMWSDLQPFWKKRGTAVLLISHDRQMLIDWHCRLLPL
jgi:ABC-type nitrate/sulfonate/bicarbonate transport system ATPase subunit